MIASTTVAAGYREIKMLANDSSHFCMASNMVTFAEVSSSAAATASLWRPGWNLKIVAHLGHGDYQHRGRRACEKQRPEPHSTGA